MYGPNYPWMGNFWKRKLHSLDRAREMAQCVKALTEQASLSLSSLELIQKSRSVTWESAMAEFLWSYGKWKKENPQVLIGQSVWRRLERERGGGRGGLLEGGLRLSFHFCILAKENVYLYSHIHPRRHTHRVVFILDMYRSCFLSLVQHENCFNCSNSEYEHQVMTSRRQEESRM